jgi:hypothetical protein
MTEQQESPRLGDWISCYSGQRFYPLDPRPDEIHVRDIAHALACLNRYTGHAIEPISVAQHSCLVADLLPPELKLWGLLHDAAEAYVNDMARPIKLLPEMAAYRAAEHRLMQCVALRFQLVGPGPDGEMPAEVKRADNVALKAEARLLMPSRCGTWSKWIDEVPDAPREIASRIRPTWPWHHARAMFLDYWRRLTGEAIQA